MLVRSGVMSPIQCTNLRCDGIREAKRKDNDKVKHIVDESSCSKFYGRMMAYHQGVSKSQNDGAKLTYDYRQSQQDKLAVVGRI